MTVTRRATSFRFIFAASALAALVVSAPASAEPEGPARVSARGSGHFTTGGEWRNFAFTARLMPDGTVQGMGNIRNRSNDNHVKFSIDCLRIDGNAASMHGHVTHSTVPEWEDGEIWFRATDNGEGSADAPDLMTQVGIYAGGPAPSCAVDDPFVLGTEQVVEAGNVQIRSR